MKTIYFLSILAFTLLISPIFAGSQYEEEDAFITIKGKVLSQDTKQPLMYASISVQGSNITTVSNQNGYFSLRVSQKYKEAQFIVQFLGYENQSLSVKAFIDKEDEIIYLKSSSIQLSEVEVVSGNGRELVREAIARIPENYPDQPLMMVAFYRESIKKGNKYLSLVETVLDVYKASYRSYNSDQARIYIGRKATDINPRDTIFMKFQGGINSAFLLDIAKNSDIVFNRTGNDYDFNIENIVHINDKPHYAISFLPNERVKDILFRGTMYLDVASLAFSRMEFYMNVENRKDATPIFIKKKPRAMRTQVKQAKYTIHFIEQNKKWYFNYCSTELTFNVRWKNRFFGLFSSTYTIASEMAITDRYHENVTKFPRKERIRSADVIAEKVEHFTNPDFWGVYNVIEPDIEINNAIKKLKGKLQRREKH